MEGDDLVARYWLSFDLGFGADYEYLFEWLDRLEAKECTPSTATFDTDMTIAAIERELKELLKDNKRARLYIIFMKNSRMIGRWVAGKRKAAPWSGYYVPTSEEDEDEY